MATRTDAPTRREQILKEAARLFAERGFHGVGVDEIGAAVGISGPGLYRHFAGKDAMLAELLVGISGQLLTGARRRVAEADGEPAGRDPGRVLDSLIEGHIDFALDDRPLITLHDRELDRLRDTDRKMVRQLQRQYVELWVVVSSARCTRIWPSRPPLGRALGLRPAQLDTASGTAGFAPGSRGDVGAAAPDGEGGVRGGRVGLSRLLRKRDERYVRTALDDRRDRPVTYLLSKRLATGSPPA